MTESPSNESVEASDPASVGPFELATFPLHLGHGGTAVVQPAFAPEMQWYLDYGQRHGSEGTDTHLVSMHTMTGAWDSWEMHPAGTEVVVVTDGSFTLVQERDGKEVRIPLQKGEYALNPPGVWHTADVEESVTAVFLTVGAGTQVRPRS